MMTMLARPLPHASASPFAALRTIAASGCSGARASTTAVESCVSTGTEWESDKRSESDPSGPKPTERRRANASSSPAIWTAISCACCAPGAARRAGIGTSRNWSDGNSRGAEVLVENREQVQWTWRGGLPASQPAPAPPGPLGTPGIPHRAPQPVHSYTHPPLEPWSPGALEPWSPGALEPWSPGALEPWSLWRSSRAAPVSRPRCPGALGPSAARPLGPSALPRQRQGRAALPGTPQKGARCHVRRH